MPGFGRGLRHIHLELVSEIRLTLTPISDFVLRCNSGLDGMQGLTGSTSNLIGPDEIVYSHSH